MTNAVIVLLTCFYWKWRQVLCGFDASLLFLSKIKDVNKNGQRKLSSCFTNINHAFVGLEVHMKQRVILIDCLEPKNCPRCDWKDTVYACIWKIQIDYQYLQIPPYFRAFTEISSCLVNKLSRWGIKQLGIFVLVPFFFYFPMIIGWGHDHITRGEESPALGS